MVKWNNIDLKSKGIIVEEVPTIPKAQKNIEKYSIEGRNGFLTIDNNTYKEIPYTLNCHLRDDEVNIDEIKSFLDGYGTLSIEDDREYTGYINNAISFEKVALTFRKFQIRFTLNPISYDTQFTERNVTSTFKIDGNYETAPILIIRGNDDISITINNETFYLYGINGTYTLDCDKMIITDSNGNNVSSKMFGKFPKLKAGNNIISTTGTISSFKIKYKNAWL